MRSHRSAAALAALLPLAIAGAQETAPPRRIETPLGMLQLLRADPAGDGVRCTLWVRYPDDRGELRDHAQYLADLQIRFRERRVAIGVALPAAAAARLAATEPGFQVGALDGADADAAPTQTTAVLLGERGASFAWEGLDGAVDLLERWLRGELDDPRPEWSQLLGLVARVADGGEFAGQVEQAVGRWPHSGKARAVAVLCQWWCTGDLAAAGRAFDAGLDALAGEAVPLTVFADLVLRGDRTDPTIPRRLAAALQPVAATAPDGVFTQLVYLRALLRAGQDRVAGRVAATLPKRLVGRPVDLLVFAETLMESGTPAPFRDLAMRAIADAEAAPGCEPRWAYGARHKVLTRCGDADAAAKLMADYRARQIDQSGLNNDAWYMIVRPDTMGRFDTLALAQAEEMLRVEGAGIDYGSKDTVALAYFVNGRVAQAAELQAEATQASGDRSTYVGRLTRYRQTLAALAARKAAADARQGGDDKGGK